MPRFVVFYNGTTRCSEREVLRLSDAYINKVADPDLELKVLMLNVNYGYNKDLMEKCRTLLEYSQYVAKVREFKNVYDLPIEEAVPRAVDYCIEAGILADFLIKQRAEVIAMSIFEYNEELKWKKIGESNYRDGKADGIAEGKVVGIIEGKAEALLTILSSQGEISDSLRSRILAEKDEEMIQRWLGLALKVKSVEEFCELM